jgi:transcriptional regulator with XRE-family HTH domain
MGGDELRRLRTVLDLTQAGLADELGVTSNTVARWERDEVAIPEPVARLAKLLVKLRRTPRKRRGG